jgi:hypothetical protein
MNFWVFLFALAPLPSKRFFISCAVPPLARIGVKNINIVLKCWSIRFIIQHFRARRTLKNEYRRNSNYLFSPSCGKRKYNEEFKYCN